MTCGFSWKFTAEHFPPKPWKAETAQRKQAQEESPTDETSNESGRCTITAATEDLDHFFTTTKCQKDRHQKRIFCCLNPLIPEKNISTYERNFPPYSPTAVLASKSCHEPTPLES